MQAVGFEGKGIYVAGDVSGYIEPDTGRPTPQIVEAAEQTAHTAAANILADINGGSKHKHESKYQGTMVSIHKINRLSVCLKYCLLYLYFTNSFSTLFLALCLG